MPFVFLFASSDDSELESDEDELGFAAFFASVFFGIATFSLAFSSSLEEESSLDDCSCFCLIPFSFITSVLPGLELCGTFFPCSLSSSESESDDDDFAGIGAGVVVTLAFLVTFLTA